MNNADLADGIAAEADISKADALKAVKALTPVITSAIKDGNQVNITGLGIFKPKHTAARMGRNVRTQEPMQISAKNGVSFASSSVLKKVLNED